MVFDAFISYSRSSSTDEAVALKSGLESYARPWNKARSTHVFLDDASLSASFSLAGTLSQSLSQSRWLIVLLSEASARSPWVDQEVAWWIQNKGSEHILLVHVDGRIDWRDGGFAVESTAIPPSLRTLREEPRWVDMTWTSALGDNLQQDPRFNELILQIFCPIHGLERGEAVARRDANVRRAKRLTRGAITSLSGLLILALVSAAFAYVQMRVAQDQTEVATVRLLNSESQRVVGYNVGLARLLAAQANSALQDDQSRRTLFGSLTAGPNLVGELMVDSPKALATTPDGSIVVVNAGDGALLRWHVAGRSVERIGDGCGGYGGTLQISNDGHIVVGTCYDGASFAYVDATSLELPTAGSITVSPSGRTIAYLNQTGLFIVSGVGQDTSTRALTWRGAADDIALRDDDTLSMIDTLNARGTVYDLAHGRELAQYGFTGSAPEYQRVLSRTGESYWDSSGLWTLPVGGAPSGPLAIDQSAEPHDFVAMAISDRGDTAAYALSGGSIEVTSPARNGADVRVRARLEAGDSVSPIVIGGSEVVVAGHDGVVSIWDLRQSSPIVSTVPLQKGAKELANSIPGDDVVVVPNADGSATVFGDYWGFTVMDDQGAAVFDRRSTSDEPHFVGWLSTSEFAYLSGGMVRVFDVSSQQETQHVAAPALGDAGISVGWDDASHSVLLADDQAYHRFDLSTQTDESTPLEGREIAAISPDGSRVLIAAGGNEANEVWDSALKRQIYRAATKATLSFASNGDVVERSAESPSVKLLGLDGGQVVMLTAGGARGDTASAFNQFPVAPDGSIYLTTATRGYVKFMSRDTGQEWGRLPMHLFQDDTAGEWAYAGFSADGNRVAIVSRSDAPDFAPQLTVVDLAPTTMARAVCDSVRRSLEPDEWRKLTGREPAGKLVCEP